MTLNREGFIYNFLFGCLLAAIIYVIFTIGVGYTYDYVAERNERVAECAPKWTPIGTRYPCENN